MTEIKIHLNTKKSSETALVVSINHILQKLNSLGYIFVAVSMDL